MSPEHRRLQRAVRILKEHDAQGGRGISTKALQGTEQQRKRALAHLAAAVMREERREERSAS